VVDAGFQETGDVVVKHINRYYGKPAHIAHVVVSHPDGDHAGGIRAVLESFHVGALWMLRPWLYASDLAEFFPDISVDDLRGALREAYPNIAALEEIAVSHGVPIAEPFQGATIGAFVALSPSKKRYFALLARSDRTPRSTTASKSLFEKLARLVEHSAATAAAFVKAAWGEEAFSSEATSAENEMSVVQYANLCARNILLTADAGCEALAEAADYSPFVGLTLPGIDRFQVPHHGSRRNLSTDLLDRWLGTRLASQLPAGQEKFTAIVSAAKKDEHHPRKAVVRALIHRGAAVVTTEQGTIRTMQNAPARDDWVAAVKLGYPEDQEGD